MPFQIQNVSYYFYCNLYWIWNNKSMQTHGRCLADLCGGLHCDQMSEFKKAKKCNPAAVARNRHQCEVVLYIYTHTYISCSFCLPYFLWWCLLFFFFFFWYEIMGGFSIIWNFLSFHSVEYEIIQLLWLALM